MSRLRLRPGAAREQAWVVPRHDTHRGLSEQRPGYVASVCPDGTPNLSPKGTVAVWDDDHLVFAHLHSPQTVANVESVPYSLWLFAIDPIRRKGYRFKGTAAVPVAHDASDGEYGAFDLVSGLEPHRVEAIV